MQKTATESLDNHGYPPIGDYAVIGDCRSAALVSRSGSIDWLCLPYFSSPSLFAAILDAERGGSFLVRPRDVQRIERRYVGRSAVLETTFHCTSGVLRLTDFMSVAEAPSSVLARRAVCLEGSAFLDILYRPRPDYARQNPQFIEQQGSWGCRHPDVMVWLSGDVNLAPDAGEASLSGCRQLLENESCYLTLTAVAQADAEASVPSPLDTEDLLSATLTWWETWCGQCSYGGPWTELVMRSCVTLKLLTCRESGAVMAALTTSLPESYEAGRNWDYRYCWLRDTSLLLQSFIDMGFAEESRAFLGWLLKAGRKPRLQPLYDLFAEPVCDEFTLPHLEGYRGRGPVRIGNSAHRQLQLDIYGEVIQTAYRFVERGGTLDDDEKRLLASLGNAVRRMWHEPDQSIWEPRVAPRHYTYSKLMCWVALDRLLKLDACLPLGIDRSAFTTERERIRSEIEAKGYDAGHGSYVGYFGGSEPDASLLLMLRYRYHEPGHPRLEGTYRYISQRLAANGLIYRYPPGSQYDGVDGSENFFAACSFWAVDYLARAGRIEAAGAMFDQLAGLANDVGLYAEQFERNDGSPFGNFPQAFTHAGLITAAIALEQGRRGRRGADIAS